MKVVKYKVQNQIRVDTFIYKNCVPGFQGGVRVVNDVRGKTILVVVYRDGREKRAPPKLNNSRYNPERLPFGDLIPT